MQMLRRFLLLLSFLNGLAAIGVHGLFAAGIAMTQTMMLSDYRELVNTKGITIDHDKLAQQLPEHFKDREDWAELPLFLGRSIERSRSPATFVSALFAINAFALAAAYVGTRQLKRSG